MITIFLAFIGYVVNRFVQSMTGIAQNRKAWRTLSKNRGKWKAGIAAFKIVKRACIIWIILLSLSIVCCFYGPPLLPLGLTLILTAAIIICSLYPFHNCFLLSSLNAPVPFVVLVHSAALAIGVFMLVKLAPLYRADTLLFGAIFWFGVINAVLGYLFSLIQNDYRRMLAYSTMSQIGFALVLYGLGWFKASLIHICLHGLLKAYLFLSCPNIARRISCREFYWGKFLYIRMLNASQPNISLTTTHHNDYR